MVSIIFWELPRTTSSDSILYLVWCHGAVMVSVLWHIISLGSQQQVLLAANILYVIDCTMYQPSFFLPSIMSQIFPLPLDGFLKLYSAHGNPLNISVWDTVLEIVIRFWAGVQSYRIFAGDVTAARKPTESVVCRSCVLWRCDGVTSDQCVITPCHKCHKCHDIMTWSRGHAVFTLYQLTPALARQQDIN